MPARAGIRFSATSTACAERCARGGHNWIEQALPRWDIDVGRIEPIKVRENALYRLWLKDGSSVALRIHRRGYHSDSALRSEFVWLRTLEKGGIRVPQAVRSRRNRNVETVRCEACASTRRVDVFRWIAGQRVGSVESGPDGDAAAIPALYRRIGAVAARMHNQAARWRPPRDFVRPKWNRAGLTGERPVWGRFWELQALQRSEYRLAQRARAMIASDLAAVATDREHYAIIHADLIPENILLAGKDLHVIDFDDAGFGWFLFDLATPLYFLAGKRVFSPVREALISGYRTERALSEAVLERLPLFLAARATTYLGWIHTRWERGDSPTRRRRLIEHACEVIADYLRAR